VNERNRNIQFNLQPNQLVNLMRSLQVNN